MYLNRPTSDMQNNSTSTSSQKKLEDFTFIVQYTVDLCQDPLKHVLCNSVLKGTGFTRIRQTKRNVTL